MHNLRICQRICIYSAMFARDFLSADLVFSLPFLNNRLHRKCIFCIAQLKGCIFADLRAERKTSTYSTLCVQVFFFCESCVQYIPAMGTLKCCGVGSSHELLSHSLVFLTQYLWNADECGLILLFILPSHVFFCTSSLGVFEDDCKIIKVIIPVIPFHASSLYVCLNKEPLTRSYKCL